MTPPKPLAILKRLRVEQVKYCKFAGTCFAIIISVYLAQFIIANAADPIDFTAFYCAGKAVTEHLVPYTAISLGVCEHHYVHSGFFVLKNVAVPAPLPPYALAVFGLLAKLPFTIAMASWRVILLLAIGITVMALRAVSGLSWAVLIFATLPVDLILNISFGQVVPIVVASIALTSWALQRGSDRLAGAFACASMFEPHIGLPGCLALLLFCPGSRLALAVGASGGLFAALMTVPLATNVAYFREVLPQQAASEVTHYMQYSVTHLASVCGAPVNVALALGILSYVVLVIIGAVIAPRLSAATKIRGLLFAFPTALAVLGGSYMHLVQTVVALPAAVLLTACSTGYLRTIARIALVLLGIAGPQLGAGSYAILTLLLTLPMVEELFRRRLRASIALAALVLGGWLLARETSLEMTTRVSLPKITDPTTLAEESWHQYVLAADPGRYAQSVELLAQAPTWAALLLLLYVAIQLTLPSVTFIRNKSVTGVADGTKTSA